MKKFLLLTMMLLGIMSNAKADDNISASLKVNSDLTTATLHVNLTNDVEYIAFQMDVTLPDGWTVTGADPTPSTSRLVNGGTTTIDGSSQSTDFVLAHNVLNNNQVRIIAYNLGNVAIAGTSGDEIFSIKLTKTTGTVTAVTDWVGTFSGVQFVAKSDLKGIEIAVANTNSKVTGESASLNGDVNKDGKVNVADVSCILNIINEAAAGYNYDLDAADCNKDGKTNVADISAVLIIINK